MRTFLLTALSLSLSICSAASWAQTSNSRSESSSTLSTSPADFSEDQTFSRFERVTPGIKPPKATHAPDPKFPDLPADAERHGTVVMLVGVGANGHVEAVRVLRSDEQVFEQAAVQTVKKWKFKPAEKNGNPVPVQVTVEMKFQR
jgi:TonB family protein